MIIEPKFYNDYVVPVLTQVKEELQKRGVKCYIHFHRLHAQDDDIILVYHALNYGKFTVYSAYQNLFNSDFDKFGLTEELIFKPIKSIYNLEIGDTVYYANSVNECRGIKIENEYGLDFAEKLVENNNLYLIEEECEKQCAKNQAIAKIKKRAYELQGDWKPKWSRGDFKYSLCYDFNYKVIEVVRNEFYSCGQIFFKTKEIGEQIIGELFEECKLMLEVE